MELEVDVQLLLCDDSGPHDMRLVGITAFVHMVLCAHPRYSVLALGICAHPRDSALTNSRYFVLTHPRDSVLTHSLYP
jgi:hypothetical protein